MYSICNYNAGLLIILITIVYKLYIMRKIKKGSYQHPSYCWWYLFTRRKLTKVTEMDYVCLKM